MRIPAAAPAARSRSVTSFEPNWVWPRFQPTVIRNAVAPSCRPGSYAAAPGLFGASSVNPTKSPGAARAVGTTIAAAAAMASRRAARDRRPLLGSASPNSTTLEGATESGARQDVKRDCRVLRACRAEREHVKELVVAEDVRHGVRATSRVDNR